MLALPLSSAVPWVEAAIGTWTRAGGVSYRWRFEIVDSRATQVDDSEVCDCCDPDEPEVRGQGFYCACPSDGSYECETCLASSEWTACDDNDWCVCSGPRKDRETQAYPSERRNPAPAAAVVQFQLDGWIVPQEGDEPF